MTLEQIEYELSRIIEIRDDVLFSKVVDFIIRHTEELRKENEELKYHSTSIMNGLHCAEQEVDRLRGLVESVDIALQGEGYHYEQVEEALAKIAEFKEGK